MRTIILTYPGYRHLPRGIKQMLVASEDFYFDESGVAATKMNRRKSMDAKIAQLAPVASLGSVLAIYAGT
ncbi:MAG: hypothetical protein ABSA45_06030 [Verrucomicrobiota bacterium]